MQIRHYLTRRGSDPFQEWLDGLSDLKARDGVLRRLNRLLAGNSGNHHYCRGGVWELCIDLGPGYRVYYGMPGRDVVLLLGAGQKRTQNRDIAEAIRRWADYNRSDG